MYNYQSLLCGLLMAMGSVSANAQLAPSITMHSENYDLYDGNAQITLALGSTVSGKIGVDCGEGIVEYNIEPSVLDTENGGITATYIPCVLTQKAKVDIYCYGDVAIDYFNGDGCGLTDIAFADPQAIEILSLRHNSLRALDLSDMCNAASIDVGDNPFTDSPLIVGGNKPNLMILNLDIIDSMDSSFTLTDYPSLVSFDAYDNTALYACDPSQCPNLVKLSIDDTPVSAIDVSQNPELIILNVGGTDIRTLDVTNNTKLQQLYCSAMGRVDQSERLSHIDISNCPDLVYFFCSSNALTEIDLSCNPLLEDISLSNNMLTEIDLTSNTDLLNVAIDNNYMSFATLPSDPGWLEYFYRQHPIELPESYLVGTPIDLADRVLRPGTETWAVVNVDTPEGPALYTELDPSEYTFVDGVISINSVVEGTVFVEFYNSELTEYPMTTTRFKVKSQEDYGKNDLVLTMTFPQSATADLALSIGVEGATGESPKSFYVETADGELHQGYATSAIATDGYNFQLEASAKGTVKVYVEADEKLTSLRYGDALESIDLTKAESLQYLSLTNTRLSDINLRFNNQLRELELSGNDFADRFTLEGETGAYSKNFLERISLPDNGLTGFELTVPEILKYLDISNNHIGNLSLTDAELLETLDVSHNEFDYLRLSYQSSLRDFYASYNRLSEIVMPETNVIKLMDISHNCFTFSTLPVSAITADFEYLYADQADIAIPAMGNGCNLSDLYVDIDGLTTTYEWIDADGVKLSPDVDYTIDRGVTVFLSQAEGKTVKCLMQNLAFPELTISTTSMLLSGKPQYVVGEFTTPKGGQTANLSLGGLNEGSTVYIDWEGDGNATEYLLKPTYTLFTATTTAGARVKVYSYEPESELTIFSVSGVTMSDVDLSGMTNLFCLSITNAGISELVMPQSPDLGELFFVNNKFTEFDFTPYENLNSLSFEKNQFTQVDLSPLTDLEAVNFSGNKLTSITFGEKPYLWAIHLSNNQLEDIDLSNLPMTYQLLLNNNRLSAIDREALEAMDDLHVLYLDNNLFTFATLPVPCERWTVYHYGNQAPLEVEAVDGVVDISDQCMIDEMPSTYLWLKGQPWIDSETGELMGDTLTEGEDYSVADGITTFYVDVDDAVCLILNELFPRAYLTTKGIKVTASGVDDVAADAAAIVKVKDGAVEITTAVGVKVAVFTADGRVVATGTCDSTGACSFSHLPKGVLILSIGGHTTKIVN